MKGPPLLDLLEAADVGRLLNLAPGTVRVLADKGHLRLAGRTRRRTRLFYVADVEALARRRKAGGLPVREASGAGNS
jgi:hypothetical protein